MTEDDMQVGQPAEEATYPSASAARRGGSVLRYLMTGGFTSALDLALFTVFSVAVGIPPTVSNVMSTAVTICVGYTINRRWVFKARRATWGSFFSYASVSLVTGMIIQTGIIAGLMHAALDVVPTWSTNAVKPVAKIIAMGVGATCNYLGFRFIFHRSDERAIAEVDADRATPTRTEPER
ncbi:MAG: GtrA family protein [Actinomyces sp.]|jgi:putative flippase GtrA|nr:GtrA family protein [Actinomyces sp.]MCI1787977.1 GtrA family protein [Actinomyces sp.]MCI1830526.1 GtrA family protein [Actinomyces sp.]